MYEYLSNKLLNELDLHFRMQEVFQQGNKNRYDFMSEKRYDLFSDYVFYCNLHDLTINLDEFSKLIDLIYFNLSNKGYNVDYNTDTELLHISKSE